MSVKFVYDSMEEVPEAHRELYAEDTDGKVRMKHVEGLPSQQELDQANRSLTNKKNELQKVHDELNKYKPLGDPDEIQQKLDKYPELEAAAQGGEDVQKKAEEIAEAKIQAKLAPVERERDQLKNQVTERDGKIEEFQTKDKNRKIADAVRESATKHKVRDTAMDDVLMYGDRMFDLDDEGNVVTKDGVGVTPGVGPDVFLQEMQDKRPHWWPESQGGGAKGSGGGGGGMSNPFTAENWNMTEQGKLYQESPEKAEQMAKAAGTSVGGQKPQPKQAAS